MLALWTPPDPEDALELLGPAFTHPAVRRYAIGRLNQAPDDDLMLYLLQLVQALKYEDFEGIKNANQRLVKESEKIERFIERDPRIIDNPSNAIISSTVGFSETSFVI